MASSALVAPHERVPGRGAVRGRADLADLARQLQRVRSRCGSSTPGRELPPANFAGRVGAFIGELSYQMLGYAAYLIPLVLVVIGWHYFWCRAMDAAYTKLLGAALLFGCISSFLSLAFGTLDVARQGVPRRRLHRRSPRGGARRVPEPHRLDHPDPDAAVRRDHPVDAVLVRPAVLRARRRWPASAGPRCAPRRERRRDEKAREKQRQEVLKKHLGKERGSKEPKEPKDRSTVRSQPPCAASEPLRQLRRAFAASDSFAIEDRRDDRRRRRRLEGRLVEADAAADQASAPQMAAKEPSLPLPEPEKAPVERKKGAFTLPPNALLDAPKAERKIDERELMDGARLLEEKCREFSVEGHRRPDPSRARWSRPTSSSRTPA